LFSSFPADDRTHSKYIDIEPVFLTMTPYHVIVASNELVYVWQYRTPVTKLTSVGGAGALGGAGAGAAAASPTNQTMKRKEGRESVFHVDFPADRVSPNNPAAPAALQPLPGVVTTGVNKAQTNDPICCICASKNTLIMGQCGDPPPPATARPAVWLLSQKGRVAWSSWLILFLF